MLPDPLKQTKEKSKRVKERDPVFNEKFTLWVYVSTNNNVHISLHSILKDERDLDKRLLVSVWNRDRTAR